MGCDFRITILDKGAEMAKEMARLGFLIVSVLFLVCSGCKDEGKQKAIAEAEQAAISLTKLKTQLIRAEREIADLKEELDAVKASRDKLDLQMGNLMEERGNAIKAAQQAQEGVKSLTARSVEQTDNTSKLKIEIAQLRATTEAQSAVIEEQQATIEELEQTIELLQGSVEAQQEDTGTQDANDID